uniref:CDK18 n=1 Tax=Cyanistes caeruleus TaxID=156563 RepID=A0A8C0VBL6_CYACU
MSSQQPQLDFHSRVPHRESPSSLPSLWAIPAGNPGVLSRWALVGARSRWRRSSGNVAREAGGCSRALPPLAARGKMNKMKNFKRRFSLSVPRTETIEESLTEFTEQFNQLNNQRNEGEEPLGPWGGSGPSGVGESLSPAVLGVCGKRLLLVACWSPHSLPVGVDNTSSLKPRRDLSSPEESLMGGKGICPKTGAVVKVEKGNVWDLLLLPQKRG